MRVISTASQDNILKRDPPLMDHLSEITVLLDGLREGEPLCLEKLIPLIYDEMQHLARRQLGGRNGATLNTNVLVHEAFLKLNDGRQQDIQNRAQFLRVCSVVMRNVVIDAVRKRDAAKRGGGEKPLTFNEELFETENQAEELLALDQALTRLEDYDPMLARVVECRYFTGLTEVETAGALEISERTVRRHWIKARALLHQMLTS
jgi:RNA polymerase sigma factor (TIGR02999 family)